MGKISRRSKLWQVEYALKSCEHGRAEQGAKDAKIIRLELEKLIKDFTFKPTHPSVEDFNIPKPEREAGDIEPLDYDIYDKQGNLIAHVDFTGSNYQLLDPNASDYSKIMPVTEYKGNFMKQSKEPCYVIFWMKREHSPVKDACVWIRGENVIKCHTEWGYLGGKPQFNYMTEHKDWHRGLDSFIEELKRIARQPYGNRR